MIVIKRLHSRFLPPIYDYVVTASTERARKYASMFAQNAWEFETLGM